MTKRKIKGSALEFSEYCQKYHGGNTSKAVRALGRLMKACKWKYTLDAQTLQYSVTWVYHTHGVLTGMVRIITDHARFAYLCEIMVHPKHRNHHCGEALLKACVKACHSQWKFEKTKGELLTFSNWQAINFYKRNGWLSDPKGMYYHFDHYEF